MGGQKIKEFNDANTKFIYYDDVNKLEFSESVDITAKSTILEIKKSVDVFYEKNKFIKFIFVCII